MRILGRRWEAGYPDVQTHPGQLLVEVRAWFPLLEIDDAFLQVPKSLRRVVAYTRNLGIRQTLRKIHSRRSESLRDRKVLACGVGRLLQAGSDPALEPGTAVAFVAPRRPPCVDLAALDERLLKKLDAVPAALDRPGFVHLGHWDRGADELREIAAWSRWSGVQLDEERIRRTLDMFCDELPRLATREPERILHSPEPPPRPGAAPTRPPAPTRGRKSAVLFGYGHYAKNCLLPHVGRHLDLVCIHELDPTQIGRTEAGGPIVRTSGWPEPWEDYDAWLVAGYHHTHAPIATEAALKGRAALVEKPLVTERAQLGPLLDALSGGTGRVFVGFHRRFSPLNEQIRRDLQVKPGGPVSCRAVVYEIPIPANHWYCWPTSRSRVISNGCHWIDHFLFVNDWSEPTRIDARYLGNGDMVVLIDLANGASLSLTLTDEGSPFLGLRDHVEFTVGDRVARISDSRRYQSETAAGPLRRRRVGTMEPYEAMYATLSRKIALGEPGDSLESIRVSCEATLTADELLLGSR